ncbi:MAG: hypothetical protein K8S54_03110 [Spirochaetia bacterium]|nr:hypothetical protein [Spirochaetia bacterium]
MQAKSALILLLGLLSMVELQAEQVGFVPERIYVELRSSKDLSRSGNRIRDLERGQNDPFTGAKFGYTTYLYGNATEIQTNMLANAAAPELKLNSYEYEFLFEYALTSHIGLGFSLADQGLNVRNIRSNISADQSVLLLLSSAYPSSTSTGYTQALIQLELLDPLLHYKREPYIHATSANFQFRYHFVENSTIDPYAGLSFGLAYEYQLPAYGIRPGFCAGVRLFAGDVMFGLELARTMLQTGRQSSIPIPPRYALNESKAIVSIGLRLE